MNINLGLEAAFEIISDDSNILMLREYKNNGEFEHECLEYIFPNKDVDPNFFKIAYDNCENEELMKNELKLYISKLSNQPEANVCICLSEATILIQCFYELAYSIKLKFY